MFIDGVKHLRSKLMSLFWSVIRQLAEIEAMVIFFNFLILNFINLWFIFKLLIQLTVNNIESYRFVDICV